MLFWMSSYMSLWSNILFNCAVLINLIVAFFYPFVDSVPSEFSINKKVEFLKLSWYITHDNSLFSICRTQLSFVSFNLDSYACICCYCYYLAKGIRYTYISRVNDIAVDFLCRSRTDVVVARFSYGKKNIIKLICVYCDFKCVLLNIYYTCCCRLH